MQPEEQTHTGNHTSLEMEQPNAESHGAHSDQPDASAGGGSSANEPGRGAGRSVHIEKLNITGEDCPFIGEIKSSKIKFKGQQRSARQNETDSTVGGQEPDTMEQPNPPGAPVGGGRPMGSSGGFSGGTEFRIENLNVGGSGNPVIGVVEHSDITF
ncbi:uncharacterized protein LOC119734692 [Patiria miniata]|uniref:Uncharacterized protein n=1 Tax=Patiria miniata TaxID=46514 RepID=A0A914AJI9_PATMI|nr:uncharacterized protein LOC119734692 [Patiria miniata]